MYPNCNQKVAKVAKSSKSFFCIYCDYFTTRKNNYEKHLATQKHLKKCNQNVTFCNQKVAKSSKMSFFCELCQKKYKSRMGIWRHNKRLHMNNLEDVGEMDISENKLLVDKDDYIKLLETAVNNQKTINNIETQNNTQNISINVFLNEHCKDAMSLQDFVTKLNVTLQDIASTNQLGYVDGISNVIIKSLADLPDTDRPIHSSDPKRNKFFVKKADGWKKDDGTEVDMAVTQVKLKHASTLTEWEQNHPNFQNNPEQLEIWQKMLSNIESGTTNKEMVKNNNAVKKKIAETISIKDAINNLKE